ncbi:MAG TPA: hypothetical protein VJU77_15315 [Chthoniobacterales bacterium]|nr:hypothetical protein [Chthoniobacterales bacterium]
MSSAKIHRCHVCGAQPSTHVVELEVDGKRFKSPQHFVFAYREPHKPLGLCNLCFEAGRFDGFSVEEIAYFHEEFVKQDESPNV